MAPVVLILSFSNAYYLSAYKNRYGRFEKPTIVYPLLGASGVTMKKTDLILDHLIKSYGFSKKGQFRPKGSGTPLNLFF